MVIPPVRGQYPAAAQERRVSVMRSYASGSTEIDVGYPEDPLGLVRVGGGEGAQQVALTHVLVAQRMVQAEQEGYDACIPYGMNDFGMEIARSSCHIPIVGQTQAAYCTAAMMTQRIGIIGYQSGGHAHFRRQLREYGFEHLCAGMGAVEMQNVEMPERPQELFDRFVSEGKRLVQAGAEVIVCHGMSMCPMEFKAQEYAEGIGAPVLEGMGCAVAMAEAWVKLGTPYSPARYR